MAYSAMFAASFETTIGSYARFNMQRTWDAVLATPVRLAELLLGELLWAACKAMLSAVCVLLVGAALGRRRLARRRALEPAADLHRQLQPSRPAAGRHRACQILGVLQLLLHLLGHADVRLLRRVLQRRPLSRLCRADRLGPADDPSDRAGPAADRGPGRRSGRLLLHLGYLVSLCALAFLLAHRRRLACGCSIRPGGAALA